MSFYENNKEWLEGWSFDDGDPYCNDWFNKDYLLTLSTEGRFNTLINSKNRLVIVDVNVDVEAPLGYIYLNMCNHFINWKQPTEQEQDCFEMLYGVRLPWKHLVD